MPLIIDAREAEISGSIRVKRILPFGLKRMVGPFIFMDHGGPIIGPPDIPSSLDILPHPHIGISTVSYLFSGQITHRDSLGVEQVIRPGEVNWMTAGKGIAHSERFEDAEALRKGVELIQTWVALPEKDEEADPSFNNYKSEELPVFKEKGMWMRLIAGNAFGLKNNVLTSSPLFYLHLLLEKDARIGLPPKYTERAIYIAHGSIEVDGIHFHKGQMVVYEKSEDPLIIARESSTLMLLGGEPLGERFIWWNFVSSRRERIEQAKEDWKHGKIPLPPSDNRVFIPIPEEKTSHNKTPKAEPLS